MLPPSDKRGVNGNYELIQATIELKSLPEAEYEVALIQTNEFEFRPKTTSNSPTVMESVNLLCGARLALAAMVVAAVLLTSI